MLQNLFYLNKLIQIVKNKFYGLNVFSHLFFAFNYYFFNDQVHITKYFLNNTS